MEGALHALTGCQQIPILPPRALLEKLYVPGGFAHGFQSLKDNCEVFYQKAEFYVPGLARGLRWNDPVVGISWPLPDATLSPRDRDLPTWADVQP